MFQAPSFGNVYYIMVYCIPYMEVTVDFLPYMVETVGQKKEKGKTWRNEVDTKTVKIATSEIHISKLKKNFTIV